MLKNKISFEDIYKIIPKWQWGELKVGLEKSIICNKDIISYSVYILSDDIVQFDTVLELSIAEEDEVEEILSRLVLNEKMQNCQTISHKWVFAIIYESYMNNKDNVYEVIDDVYTEFEYPEVISSLIGYMPCDDGRILDTKLNEYIEINKKIWC